MQYLLIQVLSFALSEGKVAALNNSGFVACSERARARLQYLLIQVFSFAQIEGKFAVFTYSGFFLCSD